MPYFDHGKIQVDIASVFEAPVSSSRVIRSRFHMPSKDSPSPKFYQKCYGLGNLTFAIIEHVLANHELERPEFTRKKVGNAKAVLTPLTTVVRSAFNRSALQMAFAKAAVADDALGEVFAVLEGTAWLAGWGHGCRI
ncbi:hypothetical protein CIHG_09359 [Coccidioides immitis H538.4]|uniref:Uncharacterized protein n=1 Tax=Coccidioides immitis H538.4 TaxID=396776 RepID=A0A0J8S5B0_COCIT|nr:hypothetical protein CIHG_09359 [Coccidioides immitis H538.4]